MSGTNSFKALLALIKSLLSRFFHRSTPSQDRLAAPPAVAPSAPPPPAEERRPEAPAAPAPEPPRQPELRGPSTLTKPVLSIDLGAAYTKVSLRPGMAPSGAFRQESTVLQLDGSPLIPSLVIKTGEARLPWILGADAAKHPHDPGMHVFQNWKAELFHPDQSPCSASASEAAVQFFTWLRARLAALGVDIAQTRVRIALPDFANFDHLAAVTAEVLARAGWKPLQSLSAREPHANIVGLATQGRNHVVWQYPDAFPLFNYGTMYGRQSPFLAALRHFALGNGPQYMKGMVVDIGAFTTDIASLTVNLSASDHEYDDGVEAAVQTSFRHGIVNELDKPLLDELFSRHGVAQPGLDFYESENLKQKLYAGETYHYLGVTGGSFELGEAVDQEIVRQHLDNFAVALCDRLSPFIRADSPNWVSLTGGGSLITRIAEHIKTYLRDHSVRTATLGEDPSSRDGEAAWLHWSATGEKITRLATALGGASVILDAPPTKPAPTPRPQQPRIAAPAVDAIISCTCQGLNKDCFRCGGVGFYRSST